MKPIFKKTSTNNEYCKFIIGVTFMVSCLGILPATSFGQEPLTVDGTTYEQISLKKEYPSSLFIEHSGGTAFIEKSKLTKSQINTIVSGKSQSSAGNKTQSSQEIADDGYIYKRDSDNNITSIRVPDSITDIQCLKFKDAPALTSVYLGANWTNFGAQNFYTSEKLVKFEVSPENPQYSSENGDVFNKDKTVLIRVPTGKVGSYTTPKGVKRIANLAISHQNKITEVVVRDGVEEIEEQGIGGNLSSLTNIVIPTSVTKIHDNAFWGYKDSIVSIYLPKQFHSKDELIRIGFDEDRFLDIVKESPTTRKQ